MFGHIEASYQPQAPRFVGSPNSMELLVIWIATWMSQKKLQKHSKTSGVVSKFPAGGDIPQRLSQVFNIQQMFLEC